MKKLMYVLLLTMSACYNTQQPISNHPAPAPLPSQPGNPEHNVIQIALLLDVSNSMDGLIDQAKSELWSIVNEVSKASKNGHPAKLEIALYEYGRQSLTMRSGYVKKLLDYTSDLDTISQVLFSLTTNGGDEYCGNVIRHSLKELEWRDNDSMYRVIFIAGNEPFDQGDVSYKSSCMAASEQHIIVNTIHCGDEATGIQEFWKDGATKGKGAYFFINQDAAAEEIATPYDDKIIMFNDSINSTYIAYGSAGETYKQNQALQDENALNMSKSGAINRAATKSNKTYYSNTKWDAVDASSEDPEWIIKAKDQDLPTELKGKTVEQKKAILSKKEKARSTYSKYIAQLNKERTDYLSKHSNGPGERTLGKALISAIRKQAMAKGFVFTD